MRLFSVTAIVVVIALPKCLSDSSRYFFQVKIRRPISQKMQWSQVSKTREKGNTREVTLREVCHANCKIQGGERLNKRGPLESGD